jgi:hypothetical protein
MTDPPPSETPLDKRCVSFLVTTNIGSCTTNNDEGSTPDVSSNDPPMMNNDTLCTDDSARDQYVTALQELQTCRENHKRVGLRYTKALKNSKVASLKYSYVEPISSLSTTQFLVKETVTCTVSCQVNLAINVSWRGEQFQIVTGTCSYYLSTRMICPFACAAMQQVSMDIDRIDNVHPFYCVWYHPLWKEAIKSFYLSDYEDSPDYSLGCLEPTSNVPLQDPSSIITAEDTMHCFNSEIFDKILLQESMYFLTSQRLKQLTF